MISLLHSSSARAHRGAAHLIALLGLASLAVLPSAHAGVVSGDTFTMNMFGYNTTDPNVSADNVGLINPTLTYTFGTDTTYPNGGVPATQGGAFQPLTAISTETTTAGITTDTLIVSVPTNFDPAYIDTDFGGNTINAIDFSFGYVKGLASNGGNPLDFSPAYITPISITGSVTFTYDTVTTSVALIPTAYPTNGNMSLSAEEAVQSTSFVAGSTAPIANYDITSFSFTITYASVPEPSTVATMLLGAGGLLWIVARRRSRA